MTDTHETIEIPGLDDPIEVTVELLQDKHEPKVEALSFVREGDSIRITGLKATGAWNVKREYACRFTLRELLTRRKPAE